MKTWVLLLVLMLGAWAGRTMAQYQLNPARIEQPLTQAHAKSRALRMDELKRLPRKGVSAFEVSDYVYGNYQGDFRNPPHADLNPRRAFIIQWESLPYRFVFSHEASYCPWFEFPSGAGVSFQFFEGNLGWAELMNVWGRREQNSFVEILVPGPKRVWIRWVYYGVNMEAGQAAYRGTEDFWAYPNGLILRRQVFESLMPEDSRGYAREPIELIGLCPVGHRWFDVLQKVSSTEERHALAVLDPFSQRRYDVFWTPKAGAVWDSIHRRVGDKETWKQLDDSPGVIFAMPLVDGLAFCAFGDASGYRHDYTRIKEHTFKDTGYTAWGSTSWDHWPVGWINSQGHVVDEESFHHYPNCFATVGMDFFALPDRESARGVYFSLMGVGTGDGERIRQTVRAWLDESKRNPVSPDCCGDLPATGP
ncbi:MAG: hypothetical protein U0V70_10245 [Terriglobia bacterium]